ncbi:hypothetical protein LPA44_17570 [Halobacterium sp. KA-4]|uniref:hypothetical protein n=1 Tax=Halobacterium sp. KA-4 TaxID=2896367 RepID=UPI001E6581AF|nr:hypothetical protein [Halobacterium sp. KA-4]MCD2201673.1 hypothetical protein [Halobacterium sp. KA-4]
MTDPDDFNRQQRFKEIHDARQRVADHISEMEINQQTGTSYPLFEISRLAHYVSLYIIELKPLIARSDWDGSQHIPDDRPYDTITEWASKMGFTRERDGSPAPAGIHECMQIFSVANRFFAEVGMDLEIAEEQGDAGFDYSDILEEGPPGGDAPQLEADGTGAEGGGGE